MQKLKDHVSIICVIIKKPLRIENYKGLLDSLNSPALNQGVRTGKLIIIPSTFQGSPRYMHQNYQDAMAMVRKFGRPDLFVTFTCKPTWVDILNGLEGPQRLEDRPDIVVRVFKMKLTEHLDDIIKRNLFGRVTSYIHVIEFQERGLPHAHILLTLDTYSKIRTKDDIDKYVSAELPDPIADPTLFQIITRRMIHGPCGTLNPNSPCMREGHGAASIRFENENTLDYDEILSFRDGRYVSAPETMWRLNEFNLSEKSHTVVRLAVHLPDQQAIVYQDGQEEEAVQKLLQDKQRLLHSLS
ncbi:hypothetical protein AVEN_263220-1 [Araneus ventricosus]|uniref:Helitron helicase-like domain-containing protein n=1 Tax=Araneus ventricosus TaxID=182803 RepID=A0A4Y2FE04_ARAVE|nr:hypothetical protein AVEN_263220-1 [Araneus ventricosus]